MHNGEESGNYNSIRGCILGSNWGLGRHRLRLIVRAQMAPRCCSRFFEKWAVKMSQATTPDIYFQGLGPALQFPPQDDEVHVSPVPLRKLRETIIPLYMPKAKSVATAIVRANSSG